MHSKPPEYSGGLLLGAVLSRAALFGAGIGSNAYETNSWVSARAAEFMAGYSANTNHPAASIYFGTSNDDVAWSSDNSDGKWSAAGQSWATLINGLSPTQFVTVAGGGDIEAWVQAINGTETCQSYGIASGGVANSDCWAATGQATMAWVNAYNTSGNRVLLNFGSNGAGEDSTDWSQYQVYEVSYGIAAAFVMPQIYCSGQPPQWTTTWNTYTSLRFSGVTSDGGKMFSVPSAVCTNGGPYTYSWQQSWNQLNSAVPNAMIDSAATINN